MTHRRGRLAVTASIVVVAAACSDPTVGPSSDGPPAGEAGTPDQGSAPPDVPDATPDATPDPAPEGSSEDGDVHGDAACDDQVLAAIDETIDGQLSAFAADDFAGALEFASEDFRAGIDVEAFEELIEDGYPVAADAASHTSTVCVLQGPASAEVLVDVTTSDGTEGQLVYLLVDEDDAWRIAAATEVTPSQQPGTVA